MAALERVDRHIQHGQMIGHEEGVEFSGFELLNEALDMRKVEIGVRPRAGIAPRPGMNRDRPHERAEPQLTFCHRPIPCWWASLRAQRSNPFLWETAMDCFVARAPRNDEYFRRYAPSTSFCILPP